MLGPAHTLHGTSTAALAFGISRPRISRLQSRARSLIGLALFVVALTYAPGTRAQETTPGEYQLKAAFLFNFAKFIDWPATSFAAGQTQLYLCVLGEDPFGPAIDALQGKTLGTRSVTVQRVNTIAESRHCQIVFVSSSERRHFSEIFEALKANNVVTVGESKGFAEAGGIIEFRLEEDHVRFAINTHAADVAGLRISSKLLALATIVRDSPGAGNN